MYFWDRKLSRRCAAKMDCALVIGEISYSSLVTPTPLYQLVSTLLLISYIDGILPKGPYLPSVSLLARYHRYMVAGYAAITEFTLYFMTSRHWQTFCITRPFGGESTGKLLNKQQAGPLFRKQRRPCNITKIMLKWAHYKSDDELKLNHFFQQP